MFRVVGVLLSGLALAVAGCATTPTAEENVLAAVEEIRVALAGDDPDVVWEHLSTRHRNFYEEVRRTRAGTLDPAAAESPWYMELEPYGVEVPREAAAKMTTREFHRALYLPAEDLPAISDGVEVWFEDDWVSLNDAATRRRYLLRREDGEWKLEMLLPPDFYGAGFTVQTWPSGRETVIATMLTRKKVHEVPLPVVHGDTELGYPALEIRLALERDGRVECKGEFLDDVALKERLLVFAERQRDMGHPLQFSTVHFLLAAHRELSWRRVEEVLWLLADADVRIRNVAFLTSEYPDERRGVEVVLGAQARPTQIRYPEPDVEVRIGNDAATPARLAGLSKALAARPGTDFEKGIRTIVSPDLPVGAALTALGVVGRRGEIVHVLAREPFTGLSLDRKSVEPVEEPASAPEPVTLYLTLVLRLPPGATTPTALFRRLVVALDHDDRPALRDLLAPSVRAASEARSLDRRPKGATLKEVTIEGDRATVSFDGPHCLGVLHMVREKGAWYLVPDPKGATPEPR